jgi:hypothetical protein
MELPGSGKGVTRRGLVMVEGATVDQRQVLEGIFLV